MVMRLIISGSRPHLILNVTGLVICNQVFNGFWFFFFNPILDRDGFHILLLPPCLDFILKIFYYYFILYFNINNYYYYYKL